MSWTSSLASMLAAFWLLSYLLGELGPSGYGLLGLVESIVLFSMLADLGIRAAVSRHLQVEVAREDADRVNQLFTSAIAVNLTLATLLALALALLAPWLVAFNRVPAELQPSGVFLLRYYSGATIVLSFLFPTYAAVLEARRRFDLSYYCHILEVVLRVVGVLWLVGGGGRGLYGWALAMLAAKLASVVLCVYFTRRVWPALQLRPRHVTRAACRDLFTLGGQLVLWRTVSALGVQTDPMVLSRFLSPTAVAIYQPSQKVITAAQQFVLALNVQVQQLAASYFGKGQHQALAALLVRGTRFAFLMGIVTSVTLAVFAEPLLRAWLGDKLGDYCRIAAHTLMLWVLVDLCQQAGGAQYQILLGMNRLKFIVVLQASLAAVNLLLSIALVAWATHRGWGLSAVPWVVVPTAVIGLVQRVLITVHVARQVQLPLASYFRQSYARPLIVLALTLAGAVLIRWYLVPQSLPLLALAVALTGLLWLLLCWTIAFESEDKQRLLSIYSAARARFLP